MRTVEEYIFSASDTIRIGTPFTFIDIDTRRPRIGYFDAQSRRLTVLTEGETTIATHVRATQNYVRNLLDSDYE